MWITGGFVFCLVGGDVPRILQTKGESSAVGILQAADWCKPGEKLNVEKGGGDVHHQDRSFSSCLFHEWKILSAAQSCSKMSSLCVRFENFDRPCSITSLLCVRFEKIDQTGLKRPGRLTFTWWGCCSLCFWHKPTELAHSFLFCSCVYFCLYVPFNCILLGKFSQQLSAFSLCSSRLMSALLVLSIIYLFYESLLQPWYNPLWLTGLKALTN